MKVSVTGRHVAVTAGMRDFAEKHTQKLEEYFTGVKDAHVVMSVEKYRHTCEISFQANGRKFTAKKTTKDMYASIEGCVHALAMQASKQKDRERSQHNRRLRGNPEASIRKAAARAEEATEPKATKLPKAAAKKVVRVKGFAPKPMTTAEAILELQSGKSPVLAYVDADTQTVHVVFTRPDGTVGLIEEP